MNCQVLQKGAFNFLYQNASPYPWSVVKRLWYFQYVLVILWVNLGHYCTFLRIEKEFMLLLKIMSLSSNISKLQNFHIRKGYKFGCRLVYYLNLFNITRPRE